MENEEKNISADSHVLGQSKNAAQGDLQNDLECMLDYCHSLVFSASLPPAPGCITGSRKAGEISSALMEFRSALAMSSKGDFSYKITSKGFLAGAMKGLQAKLNNLGWMARRIADGDMEQRVDFMGDISEAFNSMVEQLSATLKKLREEEERWKLAMLCSSDGIWEVNLDFKTPPYYSSHIFELLGLKQEDAPDVLEWPRLFHPDDHGLLTLYRRFISWNNPPHSFELDHKLLCGDGSYRWFFTRGMTLFDQDGTKPLRVIGVMADIQDRKEREELFSFRATHDVLTSLPNRLLFDEHMRNSMAVAKRFETHLAIVMVDLDRFKEINDTLGHQAGDYVLIEVANRMQKNVRESDMISRFGGDEFAMVLAFGKTEWQAVKKILGRTMNALKNPILIGDKEVTVTASFGVSVYPDNGDLPKVLMMRADEAMYHAKALGRNACVFWKRGRHFNVVNFDAD